MTFEPRNLVLLFYDGHERRAEHTLTRRFLSDFRRYARHTVKTVRREQTRSGYYTWFHMLSEALEKAGYTVRVNDFATARRLPNHPIGATGYPSVLAKLDTLPNPRLIGPGLYSTPLENINLFRDPRNVAYIITCDWCENMFKPYYGDRIRRWFGGFDINNFADTKRLPKKYDVLIYDKIYFNRDILYDDTIAPFQKHLATNGLTSITFNYGNYHNSDYTAALKASRSMAFFAHSETQGMAYQQCLAMNVPICAWDEGFWLDPNAHELSRNPIPCTSVPYFDPICGERFKAAHVIDVWDKFWKNIDKYEPRRFVSEHLTLSQSADAYLAAYHHLMHSPV